MGRIIRENFVLGVTMGRVYVAEKTKYIGGRRKAKLI